MEASALCPKCRGARWICDVHNDHPWPHESCHWPGTACPTC